MFGHLGQARSLGSSIYSAQRMKIQTHRQPRQHSTTVVLVSTDDNNNDSNNTTTSTRSDNLRKAAVATNLDEALDYLLHHDNGTATPTSPSPSQPDESTCQQLLHFSVERGNISLAQAIFQAMSSSINPLWPPASTTTASSLVIDLCRALFTREAVQVIMSVRNRGLTVSEDVQFGYIVNSPLEMDKPLAVMQPQEGTKLVADSYSRYEYEIFSGLLRSCSSESLVSQQQPWLDNALKLASGLLPFSFNNKNNNNRRGRRSPCTAVHTIDVETPAGQVRTFRFGTPTADVPAKIGDRVSIVCAPQQARTSQVKFLTASPPNTKPGEPMSLTNHTTTQSSLLLRPPSGSVGRGGGGGGGLPSWVLPVAVILAASDAASSLIDPSLPLLGAGALAIVVASTVASNNVLVPALKQLPSKIVETQATRQMLLGQRCMLESRVGELVDGSVDDVRMLARLWQLTAKMATVDVAGAYDARMERVGGARATIEERLRKRIELIASYARVMHMIEIEVEMETEVPTAELAGIEEQIAALNEVEELQEEWKIQAEAQDEVERLLAKS
jgi:hypothetical protein